MAPNNNEKPFDFQTVAVVLYCMQESGVVLGDKHYQMMSKIDGTRGPAAFQHQFRGVKARAKEIKELVETGQLACASTTANGGNKKSPTKAGTAGSKRANGNRKTNATGSKGKGAVDDDRDDSDDVDGLFDEESPEKKIKLEDGYVLDGEPWI